METPISFLSTEWYPQDLLPDRVDRLAQRLKRWVQLRRTPPQHRKADRFPRPRREGKAWEMGRKMEKNHQKMKTHLGDWEIRVC